MRIHLAVVLVLLVLAALTMGRVGAAAPPPPFRCYRPFDAVAHFSPKDFNQRGNCDFHFLHVANVSAAVDCTPPANSSVSDCRIVTTLTMEPGIPFKGDQVRYTLELRGAGKNVHYKGYGSDDEAEEVRVEGYSVCCEMAEGSHCKWNDDARETDPKLTRKLDVLSCPLQHGRRRGEDDEEFPSTVIVGKVARPMFRPVPGEWEVRIHFYHRLRSKPIGRLVVPMHVEPWQLPAAAPDMDPSNYAAVSVKMPANHSDQ